MPFITRLVGALHVFTLLLICRAAPIVDSTIPAAKTTIPETYSVVSGDSLSIIATRFNTTLPALEACNPQIVNPDFITQGQILSLPQSPSTSGASPSSGKYTVVQGDNLPAIAKKLNTTLAAIEAANPTVKDYNSFATGQVLNAPATGGAATGQTGGNTPATGGAATVHTGGNTPAMGGAATAQTGGNCGKLP